MKIFKIALLSLFAITIFSSCQKELSVEGGNINLPGGTWQFQDSTVQYNGNIDSAFIRDFGGTKVLSLVGKSLSGQESFSIQLYTTGDFAVGSYPASSSSSEFTFSTSAKTIFKGDFLAGPFTVNIVSLANNKIVGTFSGQVEDSTGKPTQITSGTFISTIDLTNNGGQSNTSAGTLGATAGACTPVTLAGTYLQGKAFNDSNTVQIQVNVTTVGTYNIATSAVNGVSFSKTGTFTTTGLQNILLAGTGTPLNAGVQNFTITYGASTCNFPITFLPGTVNSQDYFPTTVNSNWAYGLESGSTSDSILNMAIAGTYTFSGNDYTAFTSDDIPPSGTPDTAFYRKTAGDYFEYIDLTNIFQFDAPVRGEYTFLKDNVGAGTSFQSQTFSGTIVGIPVTGYIQTTITEAGVAATVGSLTFPDVIKVTYDYYISALPGTPVASEEKWFARGVGLIYYNNIENDIFNIGRYQVF